MHAGERVGLYVLHESLEGLCLLLKNDDVVSGALYASIFFYKGESPIDKVLVGQLEVTVAN